MGNQPTNQDLHVLLVEQRGDLKLLISKVNDLSQWKDKHEENDKVAHDALHKRVSEMKKYGGAVSLVSAAVGFFAATLGFKLGK